MSGYRIEGREQYEKETWIIQEYHGNKDQSSIGPWLYTQYLRLLDWAIKFRYLTSRYTRRLVIGIGFGGWVWVGVQTYL